VEQAEQGAGFIGKAYVGLGTNDNIHLFLAHMQESKSLAAEGLNPNRTALCFHNPKLEVGLGHHMAVGRGWRRWCHALLGEDLDGEGARAGHRGGKVA
jgi:hypothetical protein